MAVAPPPGKTALIEFSATIDPSAHTNKNQAPIKKTRRPYTAPKVIKKRSIARVTLFSGGGATAGGLTAGG